MSFFATSFNVDAGAMIFGDDSLEPENGELGANGTMQFV